jgi:hypothetical protein
MWGRLIMARARITAVVITAQGRMGTAAGAGTGRGGTFSRACAQVHEMKDRSMYQGTKIAAVVSTNGAATSLKRRAESVLFEVKKRHEETTQSNHLLLEQLKQ